MSKALRSKGLGVAFDFVYEVVTIEVPELQPASLLMGVLSGKILMLLNGVNPTINCDLLKMA